MQVLDDLRFGGFRVVFWVFRNYNPVGVPPWRLPDSMFFGFWIQNWIFREPQEPDFVCELEPLEPEPPGTEPWPSWRCFSLMR